MKSIFTLVILFAATVLQSQTTIFVTPNGTGDGTSWANACNLEEAMTVAERSRSAAPLNDRVQIWVQKGTYFPSKMLVIPDSVKIYGGFSGTETLLSQRLVAANPTIVDGQQKIGSIFRLENSAEINGFTIQNGNANGNPQKNGGGVWANENTIIENCVITNNSASLNGGGIYANGKVKIINSTIEENIANGSGINTFGNCQTIITNLSSFPNVADCKAGIYDVGEANFKSSTTWKISDGTIAQEWSDMVMATNCNKTTFSGGTGAIPLADCRTNSNRASYGDLFSWCAVMHFAHVLCPAPWRVPTIEDFRNLDKAMGGSGTARTNSAQIIWYTGSGDNQWGSLYCGAFNTAFYGQGSYGRYWTQSPNGAKAYILLFNSNGYIDFSATPDRHYGFSLRCVR